MMDLGFVLKALGYGAMGIAAVVLCLSYMLVRQLAAASPPRPTGDPAWLLVQKYMRFALICTCAMVVLQLSDQAIRMVLDKKLNDLAARVLSPRNFDTVPEWHW
jgi:hypothetical protein